MQALKSYEEALDLVEPYVQRVVFVAPTYCIFETTSQKNTEHCVELLQNFSAHAVERNEHHYVTISL